MRAKQRGEGARHPFAPGAGRAAVQGGAAARGRRGRLLRVERDPLERLGLSQYAEAFAEEEFSLEILRESVRTYYYAFPIHR